MKTRKNQAVPPARRLVAFTAGLALLLCALEFLVRRNAALFEGASHRALAKAAMSETHPRVDFLFLGTSRTQDGVSPALVTQALGELAPALEGLRGYNAAFTGSSLDTLRSIAPRYQRRRGIGAVIIELSDPQISNDPSPWAEAGPAPATFEDKLARQLRKLALVRYRTAFLADNLGRLPALLLFAPSLGGWETRGVDQVASWLGRKEPAATGFDARLWTPEVFTPAAPPQKLAAAQDIIATRLADLARSFMDHGIHVAFAVPPLTRRWQPAPERDEMRPLFSEVARRGGCEVWNYAAMPVPDDLSRDPSHLNSRGRAHWSRALAQPIARLFEGR